MKLNLAYMKTSADSNDWSQGVNLIGATGDVASEFIRKATEEDFPEGEHWENSDLAANPVPHEHPTKITAIASSKKYFVNLAGISAEDLRSESLVRDQLDDKYETKEARQRAIVKANVKRILDAEGTEYTNPKEIVEAIQSQVQARITDTGSSPVSSEHMVYVDAAVGNLKPLYQAALNNGSAVLAVNKDTLANASLEEFREYTARGMLEFKATVGAGAQAVDICQKTSETAHPIDSIQATLSGTLAELCHRLGSEDFLEGRIKFSEIAQKLYDKKFTEPHPHTDFSGSDVKKKITILALAAGYKVEMSKIDSSAPIVTDDFNDIENVKTYLMKLQERDDEILAQAQSAHQKGKVLRYVASMKLDETSQPVLTAELVEVDPQGERDEAAIANAQDNVIILHNGIKRREMQEEGAGLPQTAEAIQHGLIDLVKRGEERRAA